LFSLAFNPEFLREGSAVRDFLDPPYTVIGTRERAAENALRELYQGLEAPILVVAPETAEMTQVRGQLLARDQDCLFERDSANLREGSDWTDREVMRLLAERSQVERLIGLYEARFRLWWLVFAQGSGIAPTSRRRRMEVAAPLLEAVRTSNRLLIDAVADEVVQSGARRIGVLGLSFKPDTDDLRESAAVILCSRLIRERCRVKIFDRSVLSASLMGTNLAFVRDNLPGLETLLVETPQDAIADTDIVVATYATDEFRNALAGAPKGTRVFDLAGLFTVTPPHLEYTGIAW